MQELRHGKVSVMGGTEPKLNLLNAAQIFRIVKLCTFILLAGCMHAYATGYGQKITLSEKDVPLTKVFKEIKKQTGYQFLYISEQLQQANKVTIAIKDASLEEVLEYCFREQPLGFEIKDKTVIVRPKARLISSLQQGVTPRALIEVRGVITDENGAPAQGVNVMVRGTNKATTTNLRGEFVLSGVDENAVLLVSSVGYDRQEIWVKNKAIINTQLRVAVGNLDELQVIAYGKTTKRFSTGNIATVKASDIEKQPVNNPLLALQGRVPGLFITQATGVPGSGVTVRIQGQNSITKGNDPLYVIDGIPYISQLLSRLNGIFRNSGSPDGGNGNPMSYINPADIESIDILKDADATAIYGSRAANGAILITTKKGKAGQTKADINMQTGWGKVAKRMDLLNLEQYLEMRHEALANDGAPPSISNGDYDLLLWDSTRSTDWQKTLIGGTAKYTDIQINTSGGNTSTQFLIGAGYHKETTVFPGNLSDQKGSLHFTITNNSSNQKFRIQLMGNYLADYNRLISSDPTLDALILPPNAPAPYNADGTLNWAQDSQGNSSWTNPLSYLYNKYKNNTTNLINNVNISYRILPGLEIKSSLGYTNLRSNEITINPLTSVKPERRDNSSRSAVYANSSINSWIIEPQASYKCSVGKGTLELLVGTSFQQINKNFLYQFGLGFNSDLVLEDIKSAPTVVVSSTISSIYKYSAAFSRFFYNWQDKYIVNVTARRDGSSRFGSKNQFHSFGAVGVGWVFAKEKIIQTNFPFVSFGKLRGSFGTTGNDQIGDYQFLNLYNPTSVGNPYQGASGLVPNGLPNPYLQWEETKKLQFGLDFGFFNDRILFNVTYAQNRSSNELLSYSLPILTGFSSVIRNFPATVQNTSLEFSLSTIIFKAKTFSWSSNINLTVPKNKLIAFPNLATSTSANTLVIGQPITLVKVFHLLGVDPATGKYQFADSKGNATFTPNSITDKTVFINTSPTYYGGFQNSIQFKGIELDVFFQFVKQKGKNYSLGYYPGDYLNEPTSVLNRWKKPGDIATIQRYNTNYSLNSQFSNASNTSDAAWADASYIRLKNVSLSWVLPERIRRKAHLQGCRLYFQGQNLLTFTNYTGMDPETLSLNSLPPLRMLTFGVQVSL